MLGWMTVSTNPTLPEKVEKLYCVLKSNRLSLYTSTDCRNLQMYIPLSEYTVSLNSASSLFEWELYLPRYPIQLTSSPDDSLFLFLESPSDKEDWHMHLYESTRVSSDVDLIQRNTKNLQAMEKLKQEISARPNPRETEWINALLGRAFVAIHELEGLKEFIHAQIDR